MASSITVMKARAYIPMSIELYFDVTPWAELPMWARKEWFRRGYGLGRTRIECYWPRPKWRSRADMRRDSHEARVGARLRRVEDRW